MPTIITHGFVGLIGGKIFSESEKTKFRILSASLPILPDADVIAFRFGIPYESMLGHRGISHSIIFALTAAVAVMFAFFGQRDFGLKQWLQYLAYFFLIILSHGILDAFTNGGLGVGFLIPFDVTRYFAPFRLIEVSPVSIKRFLDGSGFLVLLSEFLWVWLPLLTIYSIKKLVGKKLEAQ